MDALEKEIWLALVPNQRRDEHCVGVRLAVGSSTSIASTLPDMVRCQPFNMFRVQTKTKNLRILSQQIGG